MDPEQALGMLRRHYYWLLEFARPPHLRDFYIASLDEMRTAVDAIEPYLTGEPREAFQTVCDEYFRINPPDLSNDDAIPYGLDEEIAENPAEAKLFRCLENMMEAAISVALQPAPTAAPLVHELELHLAQLEALKPCDPRTLQFHKDSLANLQETVDSLKLHLTATSWTELQEVWRSYSRFKPDKFVDPVQGRGEPFYAENMLQVMTKDMIRAAKGELVYTCHDLYYQVSSIPLGRPAQS